MNKKKLSVYIVVANYYKNITDSLTSAAVDHLKKNNIEYEIVKVPGVYEIPQFINWKLSSKNINLTICNKSNKWLSNFKIYSHNKQINKTKKIIVLMTVEKKF